MFDDFHKRDVMEHEFAIFGAKFILWKLESLVDEVVVLVFHGVSVNGFVCCCYVGFVVGLFCSDCVLSANPANLDCVLFRGAKIQKIFCF